MVDLKLEKVEKEEQNWELRDLSFSYNFLSLYLANQIILGCVLYQISTSQFAVRAESPYDFMKEI